MTTGAKMSSTGGAGGAGPARCTVCGERLSSYNRGPNCYAHTVDIPWRGPHARPR